MTGDPTCHIMRCKKSSIEALDNPMYVSRAYAQTQPSPMLAEKVESSEEEEDN